MNAHTSPAPVLRWEEVFEAFAPLPAMMRALLPEQRTHPVTALANNPAFLLLEQFCSNLTVIYSPPKVGGSTVTATLARHPAIGPGATHIHCLSKQGVEFIETVVANFANHPRINGWRSHLIRSRWLTTLLAVNRAVRATGLVPQLHKPFLIAGVRDPISQYLSGVFELYWLYADSPEEISAARIKEGVFSDPWFQYYMDWFHIELAPKFGLDVYSTPFHTDRGWMIYENETARMLLIRQENMKQLSESLGALYRLDPATFEVETRNVAAEKSYSTQYSLVKKTLRFTDSELDRVYEQSHVKHFYSSEEIARFRDRWRIGSKEEVNRASPEPVAHTCDELPTPTSPGQDAPSASAGAVQTRNTLKSKVRALLRRLLPVRGRVSQ